MKNVLLSQGVCQYSSEIKEKKVIQWFLFHKKQLIFLILKQNFFKVIIEQHNINAAY